MTQETIRIIGQDILKNYAAAQEETEAAEEVAAEEVAAEVEDAEEDEPFDPDINLNLDELKFGRNYTGE